MTHKKMVQTILINEMVPRTCATIKRKVKLRFSTNLSDGTVSCILYRLFMSGEAIKFGNVGPRHGCGYKLAINT